MTDRRCALEQAILKSRGSDILTGWTSNQNENCGTAELGMIQRGRGLELFAVGRRLRRDQVQAWDAGEVALIVCRNGVA